MNRQRIVIEIIDGGIKSSAILKDDDVIVTSDLLDDLRAQIKRGVILTEGEVVAKWIPCPWSAPPEKDCAFCMGTHRILVEVEK